MNKKITYIVFSLIVVISTLMHFKHFNKELVSIHVWRQTQTQITTNAFVHEDMNILNPKRLERGDGEGFFRMEFPLMQWINAVLIKSFGNDLLTTRLYMFIIGLFSVFGIYKLLYNIFNNQILALIGAWAFNFSPSFYYFTINPLPDNLALCLSIWGLVMFFKWQKDKTTLNLLFCNLLLAAAALTKLPYIIYYVVPTSYFLVETIKNKSFKANILNTFLSSFLIVLPLAWYLTVIPTWTGYPIVGGMLDSKDSFLQIIGFYIHNLTSTLPELLLNYGSLPLFITGIYFTLRNKAFLELSNLPILILLISCIAYYLYEANAIGVDHEYYLYPFYPLLFILVGFGGYKLYSSNNSFIKKFTFFLLCILPITCFLRMKDRWDYESPGFNKDLLVFKDELRNAVPENKLVVAGNDESDNIFFYFINKKGWGYDHDNLSYGHLKNYISRGASFLYTDSEIISKKEELQPLFKKLILQKGSIKIFELQNPE